MTSPTTEQAIRAAQRSGDRPAELRLMLRAGTLTRAALEVCAYVGDEAAREVHGPAYVEGNSSQDIKFWSLRDWLYHLPAFLDRLSPVTVEDVCDMGTQNHLGACVAGSDYSTADGYCFACKGTGRRTVTIPAEKWWPVFVACGVADACLPSSIVLKAHEDTCSEFAVNCPRCLVSHAIQACRTWLNEPTEVNRKALVFYGTPEPFHRLLEVAHGGTPKHAVELILSFAEQGDEKSTRDTVRDTLCEKLLP